MPTRLRQEPVLLQKDGYLRSIGGPQRRRKLFRQHSGLLTRLVQEQRITGLSIINRIGWIACVIAAAVAVGFGALEYGGGNLEYWSVSLLIVGVTGLACAPFASRSGSSSPLARMALWSAWLFPIYVAFQLVPLPVSVLRSLDPTRVDIARALGAVKATPQFAPISIVPDKTWMHLSRIAGYGLVFQVIREVVRRCARPWAMSAPLLLIGIFEAAWGLAQRGGRDPVSGTYANRDHFSGLLEMVLPFALIGATAVLHRGRKRGVLTIPLVICASGLFAAALTMFVAIAFSLSKMGFLSMLGSLGIMGILGLAFRMSGPKRWAASLALASALVLVLVFLPPNELVEQFGNAASDPTAESRLPIAKDTLHLITAYPLFGSGLGTFFPGLLRYQTSALNLTWVNAHDDYLELISELGFVGFLIPAVLVGSILVLAARAVLSATDAEKRLFAIACAGSFVAILIHSVADFNLYVPANAMVLSWIAGMSVVAFGEHLDTTRSIGHSWFAKSFLFTLGAFGALYASGWLAFIHAPKFDANYEKSFCRFGICNSQAVLDVLQAQCGGDVACVPSDRLTELLVRDPAGPYNWCDLGESLEKAGRTDDARLCFDRALALAPRIPDILSRAARFHFRLAENKKALGLMAGALEGDSDFNTEVFEEYEKRRIPVEDVLRFGLPSEPTILDAYLRAQIKQERVAEAITVWNWLLTRDHADVSLANDFVEFLIAKDKPNAAMHEWARYVEGRTKGYPETELVFNGDFESDATGGRFDWRIDRVAGVEVDFDTDTRHSGARSMRLRFDGTENLSDPRVQQSVFLQQGNYCFHAWIRAQGISTDEGLSLRLSSEVAPGVNFTTEPVLGSTDWKLIKHTFAGAGLVRISIVRNPSLKFDNKISGTLWIDQVSIRAVADN
jgi:O-antigen ligase/tetratricopeptide (TPR) repeat protein